MIPNTTASDKTFSNLIEKGKIIIPNFTLENLQPSSLDAKVGDRAWLMRGSSRPLENETVEQMIERTSIKKFDLNSEFTLLRDSVYLVELQESLNIPEIAHIRSSSKSSIGRVDLLNRLVSDGNPHYDSIRTPYYGKLFLECVPDSFHTTLLKGTSLNQLRYSVGNTIMSDDEIRSVLMVQPLVYTKNGKPYQKEETKIDGGLVLSVDLNGKYTPNPKIIGYKAKKPVGLFIDLQKKKQREWSDFFEPIETPKNGELVLEPGKFYLLSTNESVSIPSGFAAELAQFDSRMGHITTHYAGFFDPGFGYFPGKKKQGNTGTLEVRVHNKPEVLKDGQSIGVLKLERMDQKPTKLYGEEKDSNYGRQIGVKFSKHLK